MGAAMRHLLLLATVAALTLPVPATAQTTQDEQVWLNLTVQGPIDGKLVYFAEIQPRIGQGVSHLDQLIIRPAIGYRVTPRLTLFQGYAHVFLPIEGAPDRNEDRSFQQASWIVPTAKGELTSRTRMEQRWRSDGNDTGWRLREMLRYELPIKGSKVRALGSVEGFVALNATDWGVRDGFDQVRTFAGVEVSLFGQSTAELGYLNQTINQPAGRTQMIHVASISVFIRH